jgi:hypothetical protein
LLTHVLLETRKYFQPSAFWVSAFFKQRHVCLVRKFLTITRDVWDEIFCSLTQIQYDVTGKGTLLTYIVMERKITLATGNYLLMIMSRYANTCAYVITSLDSNFYDLQTNAYLLVITLDNLHILFFCPNDVE